MATLTKEQSKTHDGEQRLTKDVYARVTDRIIADLENGIRPWMKPWHAEHAAGKINRPLRHNGTPYRGINILLLWGEAMAKGYTAPIWMTFKQALELDAYVRKGEHGSLVVFANTVTRTERDEKGEDVEREIPFMKGYTPCSTSSRSKACRSTITRDRKNRFPSPSVSKTPTVS
jgi:antirestriction protein ArdC